VCNVRAQTVQVEECKTSPLTLAVVQVSSGAPGVRGRTGSATGQVAVDGTHVGPVLGGQTSVQGVCLLFPLGLALGEVRNPGPQTAVIGII